MRNVMVCGLYPASFRTESTTEGPLLHRDAHNFADWYRHMLQERPDLVPGFTSKLREVLGDLNAIRLEKVGQDTRALMVVSTRTVNGTSCASMKSPTANERSSYCTA